MKRVQALLILLETMIHPACTPVPIPPGTSGPPGPGLPSPPPTLPPPPPLPENSVLVATGSGHVVDGHGGAAALATEAWEDPAGELVQVVAVELAWPQRRYVIRVAPGSMEELGTMDFEGVRYRCELSHSFDANEIDIPCRDPSSVHPPLRIRVVLDV